MMHEFSIQLETSANSASFEHKSSILRKNQMLVKKEIQIKPYDYS
jgi:hypothetical protein